MILVRVLCASRRYCATKHCNSFICTLKRGFGRLEPGRIPLLCIAHCYESALRIHNTIPSRFTLMLKGVVRFFHMLFSNTMGEMRTPCSISMSYNLPTISDLRYTKAFPWILSGNNMRRSMSESVVAVPRACDSNSNVTLRGTAGASIRLFS